MFSVLEKACNNCLNDKDNSRRFERKNRMKNPPPMPNGAT